MIDDDLMLEIMTDDLTKLSKFNFLSQHFIGLVGFYVLYQQMMCIFFTQKFIYYHFIYIYIKRTDEFCKNNRQIAFTYLYINT